MLIEIVTIGAFIVICLSVFLIGNLVSGARRRAESVLDIGSPLKQNAPGALKRAIAGAVPQFSREIAKVERDLKRAGYYGPWALIEYLATRNTLVCGTLILTGILAVSADPNSPLPEGILVTGLVATILGYGIPRLFLRIQANRRVERIQRGLPDALDMIRMCLTGGMPLREAMERVASEIAFFHPDIAVEFEVIRRHADAESMEKALNMFANRIDTPDIQALSSLVSQSARIGSSVVNAITEYADSVRQTYRQRAEERANKTSIALLFPVVLCLTPSVFILILGPPVLNLREFVIEGQKPGGILQQSDLSDLRTDLIPGRNQPDN